MSKNVIFGPFSRPKKFFQVFVQEVFFLRMGRGGLIPPFGVQTPPLPCSFNTLHLFPPTAGRRLPPPPASGPSPTCPLPMDEPFGPLTISRLCLALPAPAWRRGGDHQMKSGGWEGDSSPNTRLGRQPSYLTFTQGYNFISHNICFLGRGPQQATQQQIPTNSYKSRQIPTTPHSFFLHE